MEIILVSAKPICKHRKRNGGIQRTPTLANNNSTTQHGRKDTVRIISLEEAQELLGNDVAIALEPSGQWVFNPQDGTSGRADGRFFEVAPKDMGGYYQLVLVEEPGVEQPQDGNPRIVGQVIVEVNPRGLVRVRQSKGVDGKPVLELKPSSLSKGELTERGTRGEPFQANCKRIDGYIEPVLVEIDFSDEEGMLPRDFAGQSTDGGRSIAALVKLDLL